jgi:hypothetical protein
LIGIFVNHFHFHFHFGIEKGKGGGEVEDDLTVVGNGGVLVAFKGRAYVPSWP